MNLYTYIILLLLFYIGYVKSDTVNLIYFQDGSNEKIIKSIVEDFNNYSQEKNLEIQLIDNIYSTVTTPESYSETIEFLLKSKSSKYDLIIHDMIDSKKLANYLTNLNEYISSPLFEMYSNGIVNDTYIINKNMIALPLYIEYSMLFSNQDLLDKYEKSIPKTWDDLINIAKFIMTEELNSGNEVFGYSADMTDTESGFASFYEYIYSFREKETDPYPKITNSEAVEAMKKLKKLKDELGEHGIRSNQNDINECLNSSNCLFVKTWNTAPHIGNYTVSNLPGHATGVTGSCLGGYNMGINKHISNKKKENVAKVINYFVSYEYQKDNILKYGVQSALKDIYDDSSICQKYKQCQDFRTIQPILRPIHAKDDYFDYSHRYRNFLLKYLYDDTDLNECLQNIEYLTKIFYEEESSLMNKIYIIIISVTVLYMIITYCLAFTKKHRGKFGLLNRFYWFLYMLGQIIIMCYGIAGMGETTNFKCQIRPIIFSVGFTLSNTILLVRMLINFPESERRFVRFCENNFGLTLIISLGIDTILNVINLIEPYEVESIIDGNIMYNKCKLGTMLGLLSLAIIFLYKILILIAMAILVFVEWNIKEFRHDIRYLTSTLFISFIIYFLFGMVQNINLGGYKERFFIPAMITYIYGLSCYSAYFVARFFSKYEDSESEESIIKKAIHGSDGKEKPLPGPLEKYSSSYSLNQSNSNVPSKRMSITDRLISLHNYGDEIKKSSDLIKSSNNSSNTNLSSSLSIFNPRKSSRSISNINDFNNLNHRPSQITAIPENRTTTSYGSASSHSNSNLTDSVGHDSNYSDEHINRSRTHSSDNLGTSFSRVNRINSTPNKTIMGSGMNKMRSYDNFSSIGFTRKGSNISFTKKTSQTNLSRKESVKSINDKTNNIKSNDCIYREDNNNNNNDNKLL
ncbi:periplasmic binding protein-like II [Neocallimastix californiae]|uniref:Periplasmic binding protein-like II n=1 Tax=Neocallimastix californiae TaxID=1754190 RepID=A0A1Y1ZIK7_9FUNG|nr:periplasmic binding protein-like II [Neocallimastix californiae]|eukprot:ORY10088.1 periplasmic binding protein-like II [Neocallimastix californiae]